MVCCLSVFLFYPWTIFRIEQKFLNCGTGNKYIYNGVSEIQTNNEQELLREMSCDGRLDVAKVELDTMLDKDQKRKSVGVQENNRYI